MAPATGPLWPYFHQSDTKPNGAHFRATHWRCIDAQRPKDEPIEVEASVDVTLIKNAAWFADEYMRRFARNDLKRVGSRMGRHAKLNRARARIRTLVLVNPMGPHLSSEPSRPWSE
ncbi:hypothetical protein B0H13DRAFT_1923079 [Mycena leptocephala]|nr:hypothetical protein B0H13DRAFT_1923079 [Mycena leptocephala]